MIWTLYSTLLCYIIPIDLIRVLIKYLVFAKLTMITCIKCTVYFEILSDKYVCERENRQQHLCVFRLYGNFPFLVCTCTENKDYKLNPQSPNPIYSTY